MTGPDRTVVRSVTYVGIAIGVFVGVLAALPEPAPPTTVDGALPDTAFAIVGVKVFDGEAFRPGQDVRIEDGRIRSVGRWLALPPNLARVDGRGRTLVPGLVDGHVHTFGSTLNDAVRFGVTTVLDLVLVDGDLESDLSRSPRIAAVWKDGYPVERRRIEDGPQQQAAAVSAAPGTTLIADFEDGVGAAFGFGWQMTSDGMQGGSSTARLSVESGALRVAGEVAAGFPFPWAGAIYFPGARPMQPVDFSDRETLRFRTRGDGRTYRVMLFGADVNAGVPASVPFTASTAWTEVEIPLARFPTSAPGIIGGLAFMAQAPPLGAFAFAIDDVEIR